VGWVLAAAEGDKKRADERKRAVAAEEDTQRAGEGK
jgi:hypothetical protein